MRTLAGVAILLTLGLTGCGVTASSFNAGYADFERPRDSGLQRDTALSLGPLALRLAARFMDDEPETQRLLRELDGVRVEVYRVTAATDRNAIAATLSANAAQLVDEDWQQIVRVNEDGSLVHILTRSHKERIRGLALLVMDGEELVFVNLMGDFAAEDLQTIAAGMSGSSGDAFGALSLVSTR
jgi:hypothetical protein